MENREWIRCPICDSKTRDRIRKDTVLTNFPLFCPKCKKESLIEVKNLQVKVIKEPDAQTAEPDEFVGNYPQFIGFSFLEQKNHRIHKESIGFLTEWDGLAYEARQVNNEPQVINPQLPVPCSRSVGLRAFGDLAAGLCWRDRKSYQLVSSDM